MKEEQIMSVNGIGKQVAPAVDCTTHDCFILSYLPRSYQTPSFGDLGFMKDDVKQAEQQESALELFMSWVAEYAGSIA